MKIPNLSSEWTSILALFAIGSAVVAALMQLGPSRMSFVERYMHVLLVFGSGIGAMIAVLLFAAAVGGREKPWVMIIAGILGLFAAVPLAVAAAWRLARLLDPSW